MRQTRAGVRNLLVSLVSWLAAAIVCGQTAPSREVLLAEVQARQQASAQAAKVFADRTRSEEERAAAARRVEAFVNAEDVAAAAKVFLDGSESPTLRSLALARIEHAVDRDPHLVSEILGIVGSPQAPKGLRDQAATVLGDLAFSSLSMSERSAEILPVLRSLTQDREENLRRLAFGVLAAQGDDFAQQRLIECLRSSAASAPLPTRDCIRLLGLRLHSDAYPALQEILLHPPDEDSRIEAIRLLGGNAISRPKLLEILRNPAEPAPARLAVLATLNANDPEHFSAIALPLLRDESASDELRLYGLQAVRLRRASGVRLPSQAVASAPFDEIVRELARNSRSQKVRDAAQDYMRALRLDSGPVPEKK